MRRKDREVTDFSEIIKILQDCDVCRLGLSTDSVPYIVPMNFGIEIKGEHITLYFHCAAEGRKLELLKANGGRASFEADTRHALGRADTACGYTYFYASVMGEGTVELIENTDKKIGGLTAILAHCEPDAANLPFDESIVKRTTVLKMTVTSITAKQH